MWYEQTKYAFLSYTSINVVSLWVTTEKLCKNIIKVWQLCVVWALLGLTSSWFYSNSKLV